MEYPTADLYLTSYLRLKMIEPELRRRGSTVMFVFDVDSIRDEVDRYWNGEKVNPLEYSEKIKETRSLMYAKKFEEKS